MKESVRARVDLANVEAKMTFHHLSHLNGIDAPHDHASKTRSVEALIGLLSIQSALSYELCDQ